MDSSPLHFGRVVSGAHVVAPACRLERLGYNFLAGDRGWADIVAAYCLFGSPQDWIHRLQEYVDAGARHFLISWIGRPEDQERHMRVTAEEVIPVLCAEQRRCVP